MTFWFSGRLLKVVGLTAMLPAVALSLFGPSYQTNDDVAMRLIAEGNLVPSSPPLPYLLFINVILGKLLTFAYGLSAAIPWYDLLLGGAMTCASAALLHTWVGRNPTPVSLAWTVIFAAFFLLPAFVSVQFSIAGMVCAAAGVGMIAQSVSSAVRAEAVRFRVAGAGLFLLGSLIRFEGAILIGLQAVLLALPFLIPALRHSSGRRRLAAPALAAAVGLMLAILAFGANQIAYRVAPGWKSFYEYNLLRSRLGEYAAPRRMTPAVTERLAKEAGWSSNDFALFRNWFFTDPNVYSLERVRVAERLFYTTALPEKDAFRARLEQARSLGLAFFRETRYAFLLLGVFVLARGPSSKLVLYAIALTVILGLCVVGIGVALKAPPQRIFWPMLVIATTMITMAGGRWGRPHLHSLVVSLATGLAVCLVGMSLSVLKEESRARLRAARIARADVDALRRTGATLLVLHAHAFPYEDFWRPLRVEPAPLDFVPLGASARTPPVRNYLAETRREDLPWLLCSDSSMLLIADPSIPPMLAAFLSEHRGVQVAFDLAMAGKRVKAWRCRRV